MDDIIVRSEESIFECLLRWIETNPKEREESFEDLITTVRFPLVSEHYLQTVLQPHPRVKTSPLCQDLIRKAAILRSETSRVPGLVLPQYRGSNQLLFLQCANMSPWLNTPPVLYDFKKNTWTSLNGPRAPCRYRATASSPSSSSSSSSSPSPSPPSSFSCRYREGSCYIFHDNAIFSFGGESNVEPSGAALEMDASEILIDGEVYRYFLYCSTFFYWRCTGIAWRKGDGVFTQVC